MCDCRTWSREAKKMNKFVRALLVIQLCLSVLSSLTNAATSKSPNNGNFTYVPSQTLKKMKNLQVMTLFNTGLNEIGKNAFLNGPNNSEINLSRQSISVLTNYMFKNMENVTLLNLSENNITEVNRLDYLLIFIKYIINPLTGKKVNTKRIKKWKKIRFLRFSENTNFEALFKYTKWRIYNVKKKFEKCINVVNFY